jgi:hypothetical protein
MTTKTDWRVTARDYWAKQASVLVGKKVVGVRPMAPQEIEDFGWEDFNSDTAIVIIFDDGTVIVPMRDEEGNGAGVLSIGELDD